jgi:hypothetical protein
MMVLPLKFSGQATVDQHWLDISRSTAGNRPLGTRLHDTGFRNSAATLCKEVAAEPEKRDPGDHAGHSSKRSAHKNSEHKSEEEETSHPSQRPFPFQHGKAASVDRSKYHERPGADYQTSQHGLAVILDSGWVQNSSAPDIPGNPGS